jgi:hypothetical protein
MFINFFRNASIILFSTLSLTFFGCGGGGGGSTGGAAGVTNPGAPTDITAVAGNAQATISFTAPASNGGGPITGYTVTSSPGGVTVAGTASPIVVTGLVNGTSYTFTVTAINGAGTSAVSAISNSVTPALAVTDPSTGFTVTGKVTLADGTPTVGLAVKLYKASLSIYSGGMYINGTFGTKDPTGAVESVKIVSEVQSVPTNYQGVYSFTGVSKGSYIIQPTDADLKPTNAYLWTLVPTRSDSGVISISESGTVYLYDPNHDTFADNILSSDGTMIYNIAKFNLNTDATGKFDFNKSPGSGGILIQF